MDGTCQHPERESDKHVELQRGAPTQQDCRLRGIQTLKPGAAEQAAVNNGRTQHRSQVRGSVNPAAPNVAAKSIKALGMFAHQQGFGFAITVLLFEICPDRRAPIMPDKGGGAEAELVTRLLQTPAEVNIITRSLENWVETAQFRQHPFIKSH